MTNPDPAEQIAGLPGPGPVSKAQYLAYAQMTIVRMANADAVRNTNLSSRFVIFVGSTRAHYAKDIGDTTTPDDGVECIHDGNGARWKRLENAVDRVQVRAAATGNINLANALENGANLDGLTLATGEIVLAGLQDDKSENGIYPVSASGAAERLAGYEDYADFASLMVLVREGSANAGTVWMASTTPGGEIGDDDIDFTKVVLTGLSTPVGNAALADMVQATIKGRAAGGGTGAPQDLTATQARTILNVADGATNTPLSNDDPEADGDAASSGVATSASRSDHVHRRDVALLYQSTALARAERLGWPNYGGVNLIAMDGVALPLEGTHVRGGVARACGPNGLLRTYVGNDIRHGYDPTTRRYLGWIISRVSRTNEFEYKRDLSNAYWTKTRLLPFGSGSVQDYAIGVDGLQKSALVVPSTENNTHYFQRVYPADVSSTRTFSFFSKARGYSKILFQIYDSGAIGNQINARYDLVAGTVYTSAAGGSGSVASAKIEPWGNGWFRCILTGIPNTGGGSSNILYRISPLNDAGDISYSGDGTSGIEFDIEQSERSPFATTPNYGDADGSTTTAPGEDFSCALPAHLWDPLRVGMIWRGTVFGGAHGLLGFVGSGSNRAGLYTHSSGNFLAQAADASALVFSDLFAPFVVGTETALAMRVQKNNFAVAKDGALEATDGDGNMPVLNTTMTIGQVGSNLALEHGVSQIFAGPIAPDNTNLAILSRLAPA